MLSYTEVDVFARGPLSGNPVAVVHGADGLDDATMQAFARWTNLSETTFLLPPTDPAADYRVRIFTPGRELPFAGHPTLGTAHAWLEAGGAPREAGVVAQECGVGLVTVRREDVLSFAAPGFLRHGEVDDATLDQALASVGVGRDRLVAAAWIDNGPGWLGLQLASADDVLAIVPDSTVMADLHLGVLGPHGDGGPADVEVRAFAGGIGVDEDPVTGSLNAGFAVWLIGTGALPPSYVARQGTAIGRDGRVVVEQVGDDVWIGGATRTVVSGSVAL
ncbi:PhzF family phenazine biosynthesis protein [Nocardioides sp. CFH 31398]|uniref:PhzF family phenazine biosynthesis protein n=1 Tax=Nocardioides sp. CFH 31398 TaxID=2919579 RepID=UPI001F05689A|nr:PhzF family phenazine biosynthesis protein [Nocardioides sp. CFH 31398]MCH1864974.1 PhzF family phenazine biosynthesis protein [Nocardioides sp. CFH 31398]